MDINELVRKRNIAVKKFALVCFFSIFIILTGLITDTSITYAKSVLKCIINNLIISSIISILIYNIEKMMLRVSIDKLKKNGELEELNTELEKITKKSYYKKNLIITDSYIVCCGLRFNIIKINDITRLYTTNYAKNGKRNTAIVTKDGKQFFLLDKDSKIYNRLNKNIKDKKIEVKHYPEFITVFILYILPTIILILLLIFRIIYY